jgi:hypothetical protein
VLTTTTTFSPLMFSSFNQPSNLVDVASATIQHWRRRERVDDVNVDNDDDDRRRARTRKSLLIQEHDADPRKCDRIFATPAVDASSAASEGLDAEIPTRGTEAGCDDGVRTRGRGEVGDVIEGTGAEEAGLG